MFTPLLVQSMGLAASTSRSGAWSNPGQLLVFSPPWKSEEASSNIIGGVSRGSSRVDDLTSESERQEDERQSFPSRRLLLLGCCQKMSLTLGWVFIHQLTQDKPVVTPTGQSDVNSPTESLPHDSRLYQVDKTNTVYTNIYNTHIYATHTYIQHIHTYTYNI